MHLVGNLTINNTNINSIKVMRPFMDKNYKKIELYFKCDSKTSSLASKKEIFSWSAKNNA